MPQAPMPSEHEQYADGWRPLGEVPKAGVGASAVSVSTVPSESRENTADLTELAMDSSFDNAPNVGASASASSSAGKVVNRGTLPKNVIFDFDSTVISGESLEMMLANLLDQDPQG